jgi:hypothetical protein
MQNSDKKFITQVPQKSSLLNFEPTLKSLFFTAKALRR